jgi:pyrroloquinoline quinone biosynthesis protein D
MTKVIELDEQAIPALAPPFRFQWEEAQDCYVILYPEGMVKLSGSAGEIMKRCDGEKTVSEIIDELKAQYPGTDLEGDIKNFFKQAMKNGWIRNR